jgi:glycerol-3-phosphate cytidylyltransferase
MSKQIVGYTSGVFDLFHVGHLNILQKSKSMCDKLIVGVTTDELLLNYKHKKPVIPFQERVEIVNSIKCVDVVVPQENMNKFEMLEKLKFDIMFVGDDWYKTNKWQEFEKKFTKNNIKIIYFPYTKGTSSTKINNILEKHR